MLSESTASLIANCFQGGLGPSHDELSRAIGRAGLADADLGPDGGGKVKRLRTVFGVALDTDQEAGERLVRILIDLMRAYGSFREGSDNYIGSELVMELHAAFRESGYELDAEGHLRPAVLESLDGVELTEALWTYVRRARKGSTDVELVIGTAKNLEEATARHVLKELTGTYPTSGAAGSFPTTLYQAFDRLGLTGSQLQLDTDPRRAMEQAIFLLGTSVNRLRNDRGDGHGRPETSVASALEGRLSSISAALVAELLLVALNDR
jgi:hypothetical protein